VVSERGDQDGGQHTDYSFGCYYTYFLDDGKPINGLAVFADLVDETS
jgi:hypothetical protein